MKGITTKTKQTNKNPTGEYTVTLVMPPYVSSDFGMNFRTRSGHTALKINLE